MSSVNIVKTLFGILLLNALLCSCNHQANVVFVEKIDSLFVVLDSSTKELNLIDTAVISSDYKTYTHNIKLIREQFNNKENDSVWHVITRYGLLRKPMRDFKKHYVNYGKEINVSREQLGDLRTDIENNNIPADSIEIYINEEAAFVKYIHFSVKGLMETTARYYNQFKELNPIVEKFLAEKKI